MIDNYMIRNLHDDPYFNDRTEEPGMEADEATRLIAEEEVGGNPSQQKPPMSLDCWNRCYWFFNIWVPAGTGGR